MTDGVCECELLCLSVRVCESVCVRMCECEYMVSVRV